MEFSDALRMTWDEGHRIRRRSWPTNEYVVFQRGYPQGIPINANTAEATGLEEGTVMKFNCYLMKFNGIDCFEPWLPGQSDLFTDEWVWMTDDYTMTFEPNEVRGITEA